MLVHPDILMISVGVSTKIVISPRKAMGCLMISGLCRIIFIQLPLGIALMRLQMMLQ